MFSDTLRLLLLAVLLYAPAAVSAPLALNTPCDLSQATLGPGFSGHDTNGLFAKLKTSVPKKDEFETQAQYDGNALAAVAQASAAAAEGALCFATDGQDVVYDADAQTYWVPLFVNYEQVRNGPQPWLMEFVHYVGERNRRETSYQASNVLGVSLTVHKTERNITIISFDSARTKSVLLDAGAQIKDTRIAFPLELPAEQARALKGKLRLAVRYSLVKPFFGAGEDWELPRIDWAYESKDKQSIVIGVIEQVAILDYSTGRVLKLFNVNIPEAHSAGVQ